MMAANQKYVDEVNRLKARDLLDETHARGFFENHRRLEHRFSQIPKPDAKEEPDYDEVDEEMLFDKALGMLDQEASGEGALQHYMDLCAQVAKFDEEYDFLEKAMVSPLMTYLRMITCRRKYPEMPRPPRTYGLVHRRKPEELNCSAFYIPPDYAAPLAMALSLTQKVTKVNMSRNGLNRANLRLFLSNMPM